MTTIHKYTHTVATKGNLHLVSIVNTETGIVTDWETTTGDTMKTAERLAKLNSGYVVYYKTKKECRRIEKEEFDAGL